jgi:hypothetical protein
MPMPTSPPAPCQVEGPPVGTPKSPAVARARLETLLAFVAAPFLVVGYYAAIGVMKLMGHGHE